MRKLVIGLGNPGRKYISTRHNLGHRLVDELRAYSTQLSDTELFKTTVFVNSAGLEVKKLVDTKGTTLDNLLIIHDEMDYPLSQFKIQKGRGAAGHKGVESIISALGTKDFWRLRVGIGSPPEGIQGEEYVLEKFSREEQKSLELLLPQLIECVKEWIISNCKYQNSKPQRKT